MGYIQRTANCGDLRETDANSVQTLNGWVHRIRDHGGVYFIDLRDRYGKTQIVIDEESPMEVREIVSQLKLEFCISVSGTVRSRASEAVNPNMSTGRIELHAEKLEVLSQADVLPFMIEDGATHANEDLRLKHRYLDLRSGNMQKYIQLRHTVMQSIRSYLNGEDFLEIETPTLIRSTPEGARDFLVPSRLKAGAFYALPQSPQLYKQILMVSGMDKYYQFARCYRDEDARGDRQPEHTQIDMEMSFIVPNDVYVLIEGLMKKVFKECRDIEVQIPFPRLTYEKAMNTYGSDKPDLCYELQIEDFSEFVHKLGFGIFEQALAISHDKSPYLQGAVRVLKVSGAEEISRKHIEQLENTAKKYGAKGLAWAKYGKNQETGNLGFSGGISKFLAKAEQEIVKKLELQEQDLLLFGADTWHTACTALGAVRNEVAKMLNLLPEQNLEDGVFPSNFSFVWITDFPLFDWNEEESTWTPAHHMFTMPQVQYLETLENNPGKVKGDLYDLVCNGVELASGSIRIHDTELQQKIFDIINMPYEEAQARFGFLLEAFKYGPPPHGGIAPGLDRLLMLMTGTQSIREVMGFPKNTMASSPMDGCPNSVSLHQLEELHLSVVEDEEN